MSAINQGCTRYRPSPPVSIGLKRSRTLLITVQTIIVQKQSSIHKQLSIAIAHLRTSSTMGKLDSAPLLPHSVPERTSSKRSLAILLSLFALLALLSPTPLSLLSSSISSVKHISLTSTDTFKSSTCGQADALLPPMETHNVSSVRSFKDRIIAWHQGIVRIPTFVFDEMGEPGEDPKWEIFHELHACEQAPRSLFLKHA